MFPDHPYIADDFWAMLDRSRGDDACWLWAGSYRKGNYGYHRFYYPGTRWRVEVAAHRFALELAQGTPIPDGLVVCHACDQPLCCNPKHLWLGTTLENNTDRSRKGRNGVPQDLAGRNRKISEGVRRHFENNPDRSLKGEANPYAKVNADMVREIRQLSGEGWKAPAIAKKFGISKTNTLDIINRKRWAHVE